MQPMTETQVLQSPYGNTCETSVHLPILRPQGYGLLECPNPWLPMLMPPLSPGGFRPVLTAASGRVPGPPEAVGAAGVSAGQPALLYLPASPAQPGRSH